MNGKWYEGRKSWVKAKWGKLECVDIKDRVRQGGELSFLLFIITINGTQIDVK